MDKTINSKEVQEYLETIRQALAELVLLGYSGDSLYNRCHIIVDEFKIWQKTSSVEVPTKDDLLIFVQSRFKS